MTILRRGSTAAMVAGLAGMGLCLQTLPAHATPTGTATPTATRTPAAATPLTQNQASNLALRILGDNLRSDAVVLSRTPGDHSAQIVTNDAGVQTDAAVTATWALKGTLERPCTEENICTATRLPGGTLYAYNELDSGFSYTYIRNDGAVINLDNHPGQIWWQSSGYVAMDDTKIASVVQDKRWNRVLGAAGTYTPPTRRPSPPVTGKEAPTALAQRILTRNLVPGAKVASRTITATSVTFVTDGGAETGGRVKAEWMTPGIGANQYDRARDCISKFAVIDRPAQDETFGTGTLCAQASNGMYGGPQHDWYYTRGDGKVLHISTLMGAYKGQYSNWQPITDETVRTMLTDPDWDVVLRKLVVTTPTPQQKALNTAAAILEDSIAFDDIVTGISSDPGTHTVRLTSYDTGDKGGYLEATWMKVGSGTGQFDEQRDCLSQPGAAENKNTTVKLECSFLSADKTVSTFYFSHDWAGQSQPGTVVRLTYSTGTPDPNTPSQATGPVEPVGYQTLIEDPRWDQVTATL